MNNHTTNPSERVSNHTSGLDYYQNHYPFGLKMLDEKELPRSVLDYVNLHLTFEFIKTLGFETTIRWERTDDGQSIHFDIDWEELDMWEQRED
jgi:hypothetical protein